MVRVYNDVVLENPISIKEKKLNPRYSENFLIAGIITEVKGQHVTIDAEMRLLSDGEIDFNLHIAGNDIEEWIQE